MQSANFSSTRFLPQEPIPSDLPTTMRITWCCNARLLQLWCGATWKTATRPFPSIWTGKRWLQPRLRQEVELLTKQCRQKINYGSGCFHPQSLLVVGGRPASLHTLPVGRTRSRFPATSTARPPWAMFYSATYGFVAGRATCNSRCHRYWSTTLQVSCD